MNLIEKRHISEKKHIVDKICQSNFPIEAEITFVNVYRDISNLLNSIPSIKVLIKSLTITEKAVILNLEPKVIDIKGLYLNNVFIEYASSTSLKIYGCSPLEYENKVFQGVMPLKLHITYIDEPCNIFVTEYAENKVGIDYEYATYVIKYPNVKINIP